jgi:hypothetical protein
MIINLGKGKIKIKRKPVPEPLHSTHLQYVFEFNTNHLEPRFYIGTEVFIGNRINVDLTQALIPVLPGAAVKIKVELVDADSIPIRTYVGEVPCHKYCLFGKRPVLPNFQKYIVELEAEVERLQDEGEVI